MCRIILSATISTTASSYGSDELGCRESARIESMLQEHAKEIYIVHLPEPIKDVNDLFVRAAARHRAAARAIWSREWNAPVIVAAPLDSGPNHFDKAVEASADVIMLLQPHPVPAGAGAEGGRPVTLELAKNRNGPLSRIELTFCSHQAVFRD